MMVFPQGKIGVLDFEEVLCPACNGDGIVRDDLPENPVEAIGVAFLAALIGCGCPKCRGVGTVLRNRERIE